MFFRPNVVPPLPQRGNTAGNGRDGDSDFSGQFRRGIPAGPDQSEKLIESAPNFLGALSARCCRPAIRIGGEDVQAVARQHVAKGPHQVLAAGRATQRWRKSCGRRSITNYGEIGSGPTGTPSCRACREKGVFYREMYKMW